MNHINNTPADTERQKYITYFVVIAIVFAAILKLCAAASFVNWFDTEWYLSWAKGLQSGFFNAYSHVSTTQYPLDYPPIYLYPLYYIGKIYPALSGYDPFVMLLIKSLPVVFDVAGSALIYILFKNKISCELAAVLSVTYAFNPAVMFNSCYWGQTDSILIFIILCSYFAFETKKPILGAVIFTLGVLTKPQLALFAPIVLFELFSKNKKSTAIKATCAAIITGIIVFAPFIAASKKGIMLPFTIYFGTLSSYACIDLNAFNLYGIFNLNWVTDLTPLLSFHLLGLSVNVTMYSLSLFITALAIGLSLILFTRAKIKSVSLISFLYMQIIFMLTTRMHERYQIVVIGLLLVAFVFLKDKRLLLLYAVLSIIIFVNEAALLGGLYIQQYLMNWKEIFNIIQLIFSFMNMLTFIYSIYVCYDIMVKGRIEQLSFKNNEQEAL
jgi:Gpi18-like mannosyltransferase